LQFSIVPAKPLDIFFAAAEAALLSSWHQSKPGG